MKDMQKSKNDEEIKYASFLEFAAMISYVILLVFFLMYILRITPPLLAFDELTKYWSQSSSHYLNVTGMQEGWDWMHFFAYSDIMSFSSLVLLSAIAGICFIPLLFLYYKKRDYIYCFLVLMQIVILSLAASGTFSN